MKSCAKVGVRNKIAAIETFDAFVEGRTEYFAMSVVSAEVDPIGASICITTAGGATYSIG